MPSKTIIEPFRIKAVEPIRKNTRNERENLLQDAGFNLFMLKPDDVMIDLLTDSAANTTTTEQLIGRTKSNESCGPSSLKNFESFVQKITNFKHIFPTCQGRTAERILFDAMLNLGMTVPNNTHTDTCRGYIALRKAEAVDIPIAESLRFTEYHPFKGNIDLDALEQKLIEKEGSIPLVLITVTSESGGGQPVSMANLRAASELCRQHKALLFFDAGRFAENAWFIKNREKGYVEKPLSDIVREMFSYADGCTMNGKSLGCKGGFLAMNDDRLAQRCRGLLILNEGVPMHGGVAIHDIESIAIGLREVLDENYLSFRVGQVKYLGEKLSDAGIPIVKPPGGYAIYVDAMAMLPHIPQSQFPACALSLALYLEGGIRSAELGSLTLGEMDSEGTEKPATVEFVRLTVPHRVYTRSHIDYVAEVMEHLKDTSPRIHGVKIVACPKFLRHFTAMMTTVEEYLIEPENNSPELENNYTETEADENPASSVHAYDDVKMLGDYRRMHYEHQKLLTKLSELEKKAQSVDEEEQLNQRVIDLEKMVQALMLTKS